MGAISMNLPAIFMPAGPMLSGHWRDQELGSGSDVWKYWAEKRAGNISDRQWDNTLKYCKKQNIGFMPWAPVQGGRGSGFGANVDAVAKQHGVSVYQIAIAWLLHRSPVMLPIPGTASIPHLEENVAASSLKLSDEDWAKLEKA